LFSFLEYIQPTWYYRLAHLSSAPLLINFELLDSNEASRIHIDEDYGDENAKRMDAAFQCLVLGFIPDINNCIKSSEIKEVQTIAANYRFVKKYFSTHWYFYILAIRLLSLKNPLKEVWFFLKNINVNKVNFKNLNYPTAYSTNELCHTPFVSVIIPTLNRYEYLADVLSDLEKQDYTHFEVIVCDQSEPVNEDFYRNWNLNLVLLKQKEKALWLARNRCIRQASGNFILLFDDDSRVESNWITNHLKCIQYFQVAISAGVTHTLVGNGLADKESYYHLSDAFDTGNAMVTRDVFNKIGLFDRQFEKQRMGDGEFGLRALLAGFQLISNPYAMRIHLKAEMGGLRQMGSWDALRPKNILAARPIPSALYLIRKYFGNSSAVYYIVQNVPSSYIPYRWKKNKYLKILAMVLFPLILPMMLYSVTRSWKEASLKLNEGNKIEYL